MTLVGRGAAVAGYRQSDNRRNYTRCLWFVVEAYGVRGSGGSGGGGGSSNKTNDLRPSLISPKTNCFTTTPPLSHAQCTVSHTDPFFFMSDGALPIGFPFDSHHHSAV